MVEAKRVVVAVPYSVARGAIPGLTNVQQHYLSQACYAPYLVTNLCFDQPIRTETYQNWLPGGQRFTDFISTARIHNLTEIKGRSSPCVITAFTPFQNSVKGRQNLLRQSPDAFSHPIVESFEGLFPGSKRQLREVHMTRWIRPLLINRPGMLTHWLPQIRKRLGPLFMAHSDGQGLPSIESATWEGMSAAQQVLQGLSRQSRSR